MMRKLFTLWMLSVALLFPAQANTCLNREVSANLLDINYPTTCASTVSGLSAPKITHNSINLSWTTISSATSYMVSFKKTAAATWDSVETFSATASYLLQNLEANTPYQVRTRMICESGDIKWSSTLSVTTYPKPLLVPFAQNFESDTAWTTVNGSQVNKWYVGSASNIAGRGKVAFISDDGIANKYTANVGSYYSSYIYSDILFPQNADVEEYYFSLDWRAQGNVTYDALRVGLLEVNTSVSTTGSALFTAANSIFKRDLKLDSAWKTEGAFLPDTVSGKYKKLVFLWYNFVYSANIPVNPPAAIDNVSMQAITCAMPRNVTATSYPSDTVIYLTWASYDKKKPTFNVSYRKSGSTTNATWVILKNISNKFHLLTGLVPNTDYEIRIQKQYTISDTSSWSDPIFVRTSLPAIKATFNDNFETFDNAKRAIVNLDQTNKWEIGSATYNGTSGKSIYISQDGGSTNNYDINQASVSHLYYDVEFPDTGSFRLAFDWKNNGRSTDFMRVSLVELTEIPFAGKVLPISKRLFGKDFYARTTWKHEELILPNNLANNKKRLVFTWQNTGIGGQQTPIAIDNVKVEAFTCTMPENLKVSGYPNPNTLSLQWDISVENTNFVVAYKPAGTDNWDARIAGSNPFDLNQLTANTLYEIKVATVCGGDTSFYTSSIESVTTQEPLVLSPLQTENFENNSYQQWCIVNGGQNNKWMVGTNTYTGMGSHSLYITTDTSKGINEFDIFKASIVHVYRDVKFPEAIEHVLTFDWKGLGSVKDSAMMNVYLTNVSNIPKAGDTAGLGKFIGTKSFSNNPNWRNDTIVIKGSDAKDITKRLVFTWINTGVKGQQPPIAVDNIKLQSLQCPQPQNLKIVEYINFDSVKIQFGGMKGYKNFILYAQEKGGDVTTFKLTDTIAVITPLKPNTEYTVQVQNACVSDSSRLSAPINNFRMPQKYAPASFTEDFESSQSTESWTILNGTQPNKWFIGGASYAPHGGNRGAYIDSTETGTGNAYSAKTTSHIHLYRDIQFDNSMEKTLTFDWKCKGNTSNGNFYVSIVDLEYVPIVGTEIPAKGSTSLTRYKSPAKLYSNDDLWKRAEILLPSGDTLSGKKKRLIFTWYNTNPVNQPPVTIDNIVLATADCATPTNFASPKQWEDSIALQWTSTGNNFGISYKEASQTTWSTPPQTTTNKNFILKGLRSNTLYDVVVTNKCGGSALPKAISVRTKQKAVDVSIDFYSTDFNDAVEITQWTTIDEKTGMDNRWYIGNTGDDSHSNMAFISNDGGSKNEYSTTQDSVNVSHIYRDIQFGAQAAYQLTFDWRAMGERYSDYLKVFLVDTSVAIVAGQEITGTPVFQTANLNMSEDWRTAIYQIKNTFLNTQKRLVFSWRNDKGNGEQPPAAFDNIEIMPLDCLTPTNLRITAHPNTTSVVVAWDSVASNSVVRYREATSSDLGIWTLDTVYGKKFDTIKGLDGTNKPYEIYVNSLCVGNSTWSNQLLILTPPLPVSSNQFFENFNTPTTYQKWGILNKNGENGWYFGTAAYSGGKDTAIYISNQNGIDNKYITNGQPTVAHFYRDFDYAVDIKEIEVSFDWKAVGDTNDYFQVYIVSTDTPLNIGNQLPDSAKLFANKLNNKLDWNNAAAFKKKTNLPPDVFRLVFSWTNDNADGKQMPAAVDNIRVNSYKCLSVQNINTTKITADSISLAWTTQEPGSTYTVQYKEIGKEYPDEIFDNITNTVYTLTNLKANKLYEIQVQSVCHESASSAFVSHKARTLQTPSAPTFTETFENLNARQYWTILAEQQENKWVIDSNLTDKDGKYAAYISNDDGKTNTYSDIHTNNMVYSHLYRDIQFDNAAQYFLSFIWKNEGDQSDYMQVYLVPDNITIKAGDSISSAYRLFNKKFHGSNNQWRQDSIFLDAATWNNKKARLIFTWINDASIALQKPATIDNIKFRALDCKTPTNLNVTDYPDGTSLSVSWNREGNTVFTIRYRESGTQSSYIEKIVTGDSITTITGLKTLTAYEIAVKPNCAQVAWSAPILVKTSLEPVKIFPMVETFETTPNNSWVIANGKMPNKWVIGNATYTGANSQKSIYISNDNGVTNAYTGNASSVVHFYRDIKFVENAKKFELSFDWKALGNQFDRMQVYLLDVNQEPTAGMELPIANRVGTFYYNATAASWKFEQITLSGNTYSNKLKRLVFTWLNNEVEANQPPVAVDNINLTAYTCDAPTHVVAKTLNANSIHITWQGDFNSYKLEYRPTGYKETFNFEYMIVNGKKDTIIESLVPGTNYEFRISANDCTTGLGMPTEGKFSMPYQLPFFENFDEFTITNLYIIPPANWINCYTPDFTTNSKSGIYINPDTAITIASSKNNSWQPSNFADKYGASKSARMGLFYGNTADWLITPKIDLGTEPGRRQVEFKVVLINQITTRDTIDSRSIDDKFGVFVSTDDNWSMNNALDIWDQSGLNRPLFQINGTRDGEKVRFYLDDYTGIIRIGFYGESTLTNGSNYLYIDSVLVSNATCDTIANIAISNIDLNSATVSWTTINSDQDKWEVKYNTNAQNAQTVDAWDDTYVMLSSLKMGTEYDVSVRAVCEGIGNSDWSSVKTFQTLSTCSSIPEDSVHIVPAYESAVVSWGSGMNNTSWLVRYGTPDQDRSTMTVVSANTTSYNITDLTELTDYVAYVQSACTGNDTSGWSSQFMFTTTKKPCDSVWNLRASNISASTATLAWDAKEGQSQFELRYGNSNDISAMKSKIVTSKSANVNDLANDKDHYFYVRSICRANESSAWSIEGTFTTLTCPSTDVVNLASLNADSTTATVYWHAKSGQTDWRVNITEYEKSIDQGTEYFTTDTFYILPVVKMKYQIYVQAKCGIDNDFTTQWSTPLVLDLSSKGIDALLMNNIHITLTPNPAKDYAKLSIRGAEGSIKVSVTSITGDVVVTEKLNCSLNTEKEFNLRGLAKGTYIIHLIHSDWITTRKLIVQ